MLSALKKSTLLWFVRILIRYYIEPLFSQVRNIFLFVTVHSEYLRYRT